MIETLARAIADVSIAEWSTMRWSHKARYTIFAERALKALETPTPEMIEAGAGWLFDKEAMSDGDRTDLVAAFTAMIRAAQEDGDA